jgi:hypothetical protein
MTARYRVTFKGHEIEAITKAGMRVYTSYRDQRNVNGPTKIHEGVHLVFINATDELDAFVSATEWYRNRLREQET